MIARIECACCHREERWLPEDGGYRKEVLIEGGDRRPAVHPQWARGLTAIEYAERPDSRVVGDCEACGQPLVTRAPDVPPAPIELDTTAGRLRITEEGIDGPAGGPLDPDAARTFLAMAFDRPSPDSWHRQLAKAPLFAVVFTVLGAFLLGVFFVALFIAAVAYAG